MKFARRFLICLLPIILTSKLFAQVTIDATNWPYGADQIGNYWYYHNTSATVPVDIFGLNPYGHGIHWDFSTGPTNSTATSEIRTVAEAPGPAPANSSYTEYQTQGGNSQWLYEDETAGGTYARGLEQAGTIYDFLAPEWNIYRYPMTLGTTWNSVFTWDIGFGILATSTRTDSICGWGTVTTPFGGPLPCLVMRTYWRDYAEFLGEPLLNEEYRMYEWIVPDIGSVVTIQSNNHEPNWFYTQASGFYRLYESNLGGDLIPPSITNVTQLSDTPNPGPYTVDATITDSSGVDSAKIFYSIANGPWVSALPTMVNGSQYEFGIPSPGGSPPRNVRYYIWAKDASVNHNVGTSPANAPTNFYSFNWINDNVPPAFSNVTIWPSPTNFNGPYPVDATITDDNGVLFSSIHYKFGGGAWEEAPSDGNDGDVYHFTIPGITSTTIIRYYLEAVDNSGFFNTGFFPAAGVNAPIVFQAVFTVPAAPRSIDDLTIHISGNNVDLNWSEITQDINNNPVVIDHYNVYRGALADYSDLTFIGSSLTNSYVDIGGATATQRFYEVRAVTP